MPRVLVAVPGEAVKIEECAGSFEQMVGGPLQCVRLESAYTLYCNHDGSNRDLPVNPHFAQGIVKGPFIIAKTARDGENVSLNDGDIPFIMQHYIRTDDPFKQDV